MKLMLALEKTIQKIQFPHANFQLFLEWKLKKFEWEFLNIFFISSKKIPFWSNFVNPKI